MLRALDTSSRSNRPAHDPALDPARRPALRPTATAIRPKSMFHPGEVVAGCEIRKLIGQGGMGQVFEAFDPALLRSVAIKAAWPDRGREAIRREGRALAAIAHRSVPAVHALGELRGIDYLVMERIPGRTLEEYLADANARGVLEPLPEALSLLVAIAEALAAVHDAGIVHRDLKPANVMLAPGGRVVVMDFGICTPFCEERLRIETSGSPAYMAPETIASSLEPQTGHLVDVYSVGVVAFELLTGAVPFTAGSVGEVFAAHLSADVPDLSLRRPEVPPVLARLVRELMAKEPEDRPNDMDEVAHRLRWIRRSL